jgi:hypothetical protein
MGMLNDPRRICSRLAKDTVAPTSGGCEDVIAAVCVWLAALSVGVQSMQGISTHDRVIGVYVDDFLCTLSFSTVSTSI